MSVEPNRSRRRPNQKDSGDPFGPLPVWNASSPDPSRIAPDRSGPPVDEQPELRAAPQTGTLLKALGVVLVLSALAVAAILAISGGGGNSTPTPTAESAVVIAPSNAPLLPVASPVDDIAFDPANSGIVICIDAGHGGKDMGFQRTATSNVPAMDESYFNLAIAKELERRLVERGFTVIMTRTGDTEVNVDDFDANKDGQTEMGGTVVGGTMSAGNLDEIQSRIDRCNDQRADLLISLHVDGSSDPAVRGSRVWYSAEREFGQENQAFAALVYEQLEQQMRTVGYPWIGQGVAEIAAAEHASEHAQLQQLLIGPERAELKEPSAMPGVVVEVLTITSDADALFLSSPQGLSTIAAALDQAIVHFVERTLRATG
ncbi:MAG: N-acetylmuramoyl-L-alanine amidase [Thermomicrobiales bacterium]|nr:N-acetylmuramoyl-L-alanine amidase [Thermomicrobiales bacterium]